jgi:hypothetical protein
MALKECNVGNIAPCYAQAGIWAGAGWLVSAEEGGFPAKDNYNGTGTNSGTVGDANWIQRGYEDFFPGNGTAVITGNKLRITANSGVGQYGKEIELDPHSGDFYISTVYSIVHFSPQGSGRSWCGLFVIINGTYYGIDRNRISSGDRYEVAQPSVISVPTTDTTNTLFIRRSGTTLEMGYGATVLRTIPGVTGTVTQILQRSLADGATDDDVVADYDDLTAVDAYGGTGNNLLVPTP